jgi:hypothetical protein
MTHLAPEIIFFRALFGAESCHVETSTIHGDPDDREHHTFRQEWNEAGALQRDALIARCHDLDATFGNLYVSTVAYSKPGRNEKHILPSRAIFVDDATEPDDCYTFVVPTSPYSKQGYIILDQALPWPKMKELRARAARGADKSGKATYKIARVPNISTNTKRRAGGEYDGVAWRQGTGFKAVYRRGSGRIYTVAEFEARYQTLPLEETQRRDLPVRDSAFWGEVATIRRNMHWVDDPTTGKPRRLSAKSQAWRTLDGEVIPLMVKGTIDTSHSMRRCCVARGMRFMGYPDEEIAAKLAETSILWAGGETSKQVENKILSGIADAHKAYPTKITEPSKLRSRAHAGAKPQTAPLKRGRGRPTHAPEVERFYLFLCERITDSTPVKLDDLASAFGIHRRTISTYLDELKEAKRISTTRRAHGLVIAFGSDVIENTAPAEAVSAAPDAVNNDEPAAPLEETRDLDPRACVFSNAATTDHIPEPQPASSGESQPPTLEALAAEYLSLPATAIGKRCAQRVKDIVDTETGEIKVPQRKDLYRRSAGHFVELVLTDYGDHYTDADVREAYEVEKTRLEALAKQEWERYFKRLKAMSDAELIAHIDGGCRSEVNALARDGATFDVHQYQTRLKCAKRHLGWRGLEMPARKTRTKVYQKPKPEPKSATDFAIIARGIATRLHRMNEQRTAQGVLL